MTVPHRHRRHRSGSKRAERSGFTKAEKYLTENVFRFLGIAFFIAATIFLIRLVKPGQSLLPAILSFFTSAGPEQTAAVTFSSYNGWKVLIGFLPGLLALALPFFLAGKNPVFARISALAGSFWVFAVHIKVLGYDFMATASCYPTLGVAMAVTFVLCMLPLWHAYKLRSSSLQLLTVLMFYISLLFLTNNYQWHYYQDFLFLLLFTGLILLLCLKTGKLIPFYLHSFLSLLMVAIFFFRRMLMRDSGDLVPTYIIISSLFYLALFISWLIINLSLRKVIWELAATLLILANMLFYWGSVLYVLQKYGYQDFQGIFTLILALVNGTLLYYSPKLNPGLFRKPHIFMMLFLFSMALPLWAHQNFVIIFTSIFSVLVLFYSKYARNHSALLISMGLVTVMSVMFCYKWIIFYLPGLFTGGMPSDKALFYNGFQAGFFTLFALYFNHWILKKLESPPPWKWFSRRRYRMILSIFFILFLYISGFWCWHFLFTAIFPVQETILLSWFSFTALFLLILIPFLEKEKSSLLYPVFGIALFTLLAYPTVVNFSLVAIRNIGLQSGGVYASCFIAHYILLLMFAGLLVSFYYHLRKGWAKNRYRIRLLYIFTIGLSLPVILMEYDHLTVFFGLAGTGNISAVVSQNHHLPFSIILLGYSLLLTALSLVRKHRFILTLSVAMILIALAKILVFDFEFLGDVARIIVLFFLAGFLVAFSLFYPRFRKAVTETKDRKN